MEEELSEYFDVVEEDESGILVKHQESSKHFQLQEPKVANPGCNEKNKELDPQFYCHTCNKNLSDQNSFIRHNMKQIVQIISENIRKKIMVSEKDFHVQSVMQAFLQEKMY